MTILARLNQYGSLLGREFDETTANNISVTGFGTFYSAEFIENVGITTTLTTRTFLTYDPVSDDFIGDPLSDALGGSKGTYMRYNTDKSVVVYEDIDEITDYRNIVTDGLVLDLDASSSRSYNGSGTTWIDLSDSGNNGTLKGTTTFNQNTIDLGNTQNTTNYILLPNSLMTNITNFTISLWVNAANITSGDLNCIFHATNAGGNDFSIEWSNNQIRTLITTTYSTFNYTFSNNTWYNFVFYRTGGTTMGLYINGTSQGTQSCPSTTFNITGAIVMGQEQDAVEGGFQSIQSYTGKYANVSYYNRALTAQEIQQNYNALKSFYGLS